MLANPSRQGLSWRIVAAGFAALLLVGLGIAVVIYFRLIRYERAAAQHLPGSTTLALRVDVEQVHFYEPFRKNILPLANQGRAAQRPTQVLSARVQRIQDKTGIELGVDIREFVLALGADPSDWLMLVGGKFPKSGVVRGMSAVFAEEGIANQLAPDERSLTLATGIAFGQASDGVLLMASNQALLQSALPIQERYEELNLSIETPAAFAGVGEALRVLPDWLGIGAPAEPAVLGAVAGVSGIVRLSPAPRLEALLRLRAGSDVTHLRSKLQNRLSGPNSEKTLPSARLQSGEQSGLPRLEVSVAGPQVLRIVTAWDTQDLEQAAANLARWLRTSLF
jgi:hypothetical protein